MRTNGYVVSFQHDKNSLKLSMLMVAHTHEYTTSIELYTLKLHISMNILKTIEQYTLNR